MPASLDAGHRQNTFRGRVPDVGETRTGEQKSRASVHENVTRPE